MIEKSTLFVCSFCSDRAKRNLLTVCNNRWSFDGHGVPSCPRTNCEDGTSPADLVKILNGNCQLLPAEFEHQHCTSSLFEQYRSSFP
jgi:hypothetical protein